MFLTMILLVLIGLLSAVLGSLVGIGGGIIIVPTFSVFRSEPSSITRHHYSDCNWYVIGYSYCNWTFFIYWLFENKASRY